MTSFWSVLILKKNQTNPKRRRFGLGRLRSPRLHLLLPQRRSCSRLRLSPTPQSGRISLFFDGQKRKKKKKRIRTGRRRRKAYLVRQPLKVWRPWTNFDASRPCASLEARHFHREWWHLSFKRAMVERRCIRLDSCRYDRNKPHACLTQTKCRPIRQAGQAKSEALSSGPPLGNPDRGR